MIEAKGNLWDLVGPDEVLVITTNGMITKKGWAVMGRGIALEAAKAFEGVGLRERLGWLIKMGGNHCYVLDVPAPFKLVSMPVKHNWWDAADLELVERSATELAYMARQRNWSKVWMPRPGCGNGRLRWEDVKPVIEGILDDRFVAVTR